jgi:hypothetical protein
MKIKVILAGFGKPEIELKHTILTKNIERLEMSEHDYDMDIYIYDDTVLIMDSGITMNYYYEKGYPGNFLYSYRDKDLTGYDYVFLFMDDVELHFPVDDFFRDCIAHVESMESTIFSPCLSDEIVRHNSSLEHMFYREGTECPQKIVDKNLEYFCYFMDCPTFRRYISYFTPETQCMWGLDIILPFRFNAYIVYKYTMTHYLQGGIQSDTDTIGEYNANLSSITLSDIRSLVSRSDKEWTLVLCRYLSEGDVVVDFNSEMDMTMYACCALSCSEVHIINSIRYFTSTVINVLSRFIRIHLNTPVDTADVAILNMRFIYKPEVLIRDHGIRKYAVLMNYHHNENWKSIISCEHRIVYSSRKTGVMVVRCNRTQQESNVDHCP